MLCHVFIWLVSSTLDAMPCVYLAGFTLSGCCAMCLFGWFHPVRVLYHVFVWLVSFCEDAMPCVYLVMSHVYLAGCCALCLFGHVICLFGWMLCHVFIWLVSSTLNVMPCLYLAMSHVYLACITFFEYYSMCLFGCVLCFQSGL